MWIVLLALAGLVVAVPALLDSEALRERVARAASTALGHEVMLDGGVHLTLLPRPGLVLERVRVRNARGQGDTNLLSAERIVVVPALADLLGGAFVLRGLMLSGADIRLQRDANGQFNWLSAGDARALPDLDTLRGENIVIH